MGSWDIAIFAEDVNVEFLDELATLEDDEVVAAVGDACLLAKQESATEDEQLNGLAAATIAAIWAGAPFSAGDVADTHPFLRGLIGSGTEQLAEVASELLEEADTEEDLEVYLEALA